MALSWLPSNEEQAMRRIRLDGVAIPLVLIVGLAAG
jgi:hypothetical protein